jgi:hypothetical protein
MHVSCIQAGTLLARLGRPEVSNCIAALEQYGAAYEEVGEQALEMKRVYASARSGEYEFTHMASVSPRSAVAADDSNRAMNVDLPADGIDTVCANCLFHFWFALTYLISLGILLPYRLSPIQLIKNEMFPSSCVRTIYAVLI